MYLRVYERCVPGLMPIFRNSMLSMIYANTSTPQDSIPFDWGRSSNVLLPTSA